VNEQPATPTAQSPPQTQPPADSFTDITQTIQDGDTLRNILTASDKPVMEYNKQWVDLIGLQVIEKANPQPNIHSIKGKKTYNPKVSWPLVFLLLLFCTIAIGIIGLACYLIYLFFGTKEVYFNIRIEQKENQHHVIIEASAPLDDVRADINKEETALFLQHAEPEWRVFFFTGFRTGMRLGELFGLRWQDIDFKRGILRVQQNYVKGQFGSPKSGKSRVIPLSPQLRAALLSHRHDKGELVFCREDGSPINRDVIKRPFWRAIEGTELKKITPHEMRDSFASQLIMEGRSLKEVQELLGHSDIRQTMKYAHLSPGYLQDAVATLDEPVCTSEVHEEEQKVGQVLPNPQKNSAPKGAKYLKLIKN